MPATVESFIAKWAASGASERANKDAYLLELCDALEVPRPNPTKADEDENDYVFEKSATFTHEGGVDTVGKIDLYKAGCFILEAKQGSDDGSKRMGTARRGTPAWNISMKDAYGQALGYARAFDTPVPFLVIADIGYCFDLYAAFDGSWDYRPFPNAQHNRLFHKDLAKHAKLLRQLFLDPGSLDPSKQAAKVTQDVAAHLAELAKALEAAGHPQELVATFLMRCLFTMFAEDVGLLPEGCFTKAIREYWLPNPPSFTAGIEQLWRTMNSGGDMFGIVGKILQFNGGLFKAPTALPLDKGALKLLLSAAECNWAEVEPAIFGTLLERALDPKERHQLGAHFTPRAYVERLVRPTIEEPLRAEWDVVQAQVRSLINDSEAAKSDKARRAKTAEAVAVVMEFQKHLASIRVLDPACGSGNFLYVTLDLFKKLESEVLSLLESLGQTTLLHMETIRVTPAQFHGIEIKRWAKEITELVLWIGYLQWHFRIYGKSLPVPEPVLRDYKNIECRDAVLAYDGEPELLRDDKGKPITRWDGETVKTSPVTGEDVPDETARAPVYTYKNPRQAEWPEAEYIVGNPPFIGNWRMRNALGDGYTQALRRAYPDVPENVDFVMYWWNKAADLVGKQKAKRFGLITTNSLLQTFSARVVQRHLAGTPGISLTYAIPDHPWVDTHGGADVRISMTVGAPGDHEGTLAVVEDETPTDDGSPGVCLSVRRGHIHSDLKIGANIPTTVPLRANHCLSATGVKLHGAGFLVTPTEASNLGLGSQRELDSYILAYMNGKDFSAKPRDLRVIDLDGLTIDAVKKRFPAVYQHVLEHVKPERDQNNEKYRRENWWLFGRRNTELRAMLRDLPRYIATPETAKHRVFRFLSATVRPDNKLVAIGSSDAFVLGVLSSRIHVTWALAAGGRLGVGNDPVYVKTACFEKFPFPSSNDEQLSRIRNLGENLDAHRQKQLDAHRNLTITSIYNVLNKLSRGEALLAADKTVNADGLVSVLKELHDDLDAAVFDAYGWPRDLTDEQILERLVALNAERAEEERKGHIRWLRPELQNPGGTTAMTQTKLIATDDEDDEATVATTVTAASWPKKLPDQIAAVRDLVTSAPSDWTLEQAARIFKGAKSPEVEAVLDSLAALGLVVVFRRKGVRHWKAARFAA